MNKKLLAGLIAVVSVGGYTLLKSKKEPNAAAVDIAAPESGPTKKDSSSASQTIGQTLDSKDSRATSEQPAVATTEAPSEQVTAPPGEGAEKTAPTPGDQTTQESLVDTLKADKELAKVANVNSVECLDGKCTVELEAKDNQNVQMKMLSFMAQHKDEYGHYSRFDEDRDNPRLTRFVISKEKL